MEQEATDVLIIGSGIAGMFAALKLNPRFKVMVVSKGELSTGNTGQAQGGIAAALAEDDSPGLHMQDTLQAGAGLCNEEAVLILAEEAPKRIKELLDWGVPFDTLEGMPALTREGAHSKRRILHAGGDATGRIIWESLLQRVCRTGIELRNKLFIKQLVISGGSCCGAVVHDQQGKQMLIRARDVILATGGAGQLYPHTTNTKGATGDGVALAYRAGAAVSDLEFFQFHPTTLYHSGRRGFLISEAVRGEGAVLRNKQGERFMLSLHPQGDLAPRDIVARGIQQEAEKQETPYVYLDATGLGKTFLEKRFPTIFGECLKVGIDISRDWIPVVPAAHYSMGGVVTDTWGRTNITGLLACGETACTGVHGANRLASNSLLEAIVFGGRIAELLNEGLSPLLQKKLAIDSQPLDKNFPISLYWDFKHKMEALVGMSRTKEGLEDFMQWVESSTRSGEEVVDMRAVELQNMVLMGKLMARGALLRTESRGAHYRRDFPETSVLWQKHILQQQGLEREVEKF